MGQHDIRDLFKNSTSQPGETMPKGHQARFLSKLDTAFPKEKAPKSKFDWRRMAASVVVLFGLGFGAYTLLYDTPQQESETTKDVVTNLKTLGDISPDLKKVEDYYLASINTELANVELTPDNKDLFDSYLERLQELNDEYERLSIELTQNGPNELTVSALIDNLKLRLNLLYRLKTQLQDLNTSENNQETI